MWDNDVVPYLVLEDVPGRLLGTTASNALNLVLASYLSMLVISGVAGADAASGETWDFSTSCQDRKRAFPSFPIAQSTGAFASLPRTGALPRGSFIFFCRTANQPSRRRRRARRHGVANDDPTRPLPPLPLYPSKLVVSHTRSQPRQSDHRCVFYLDSVPTSSYLTPCDTQFSSQPGPLYIHPLPIAPHRHQHVSGQQALDRGRRPQGQARPHSRMYQHVMA